MRTAVEGQAAMTATPGGSLARTPFMANWRPWPLLSTGDRASAA